MPNHKPAPAVSPRQSQPEKKSIPGMHGVAPEPSSRQPLPVAVTIEQIRQSKSFKELIELTGIKFGTEISSPTQIDPIDQVLTAFFSMADDLIITPNDSAYLNRGKELVTSMYSIILELHDSIRGGEDALEAIKRREVDLGHLYCAVLDHLEQSAREEVPLVERYAYGQMTGDLRTLVWGFLGAALFSSKDLGGMQENMRNLVHDPESPRSDKEGYLKHANAFAQDFLDAYVSAIVSYAEAEEFSGLSEIQELVDSDPDFKETIRLYGLDHFSGRKLDPDIQGLMSIRQWMPDRGEAYHDVAIGDAKTYGQRRGDRFASCFKTFFEKDITSYRRHFAEQLKQLFGQLPSDGAFIWYDVGTGKLGLPSALRGELPENMQLCVSEVSPALLRAVLAENEKMDTPVRLFFDDANELRALQSVSPDVLTQSLIYHGVGPTNLSAAIGVISEHASNSGKSICFGSGDVMDNGRYEAHMLALPDNGFEFEQSLGIDSIRDLLGARAVSEPNQAGVYRSEILQL